MSLSEIIHRSNKAQGVERVKMGDKVLFEGTV